MTFAYGALTLFGRPFQDRSTRQIATFRSLGITPECYYLTTPQFPVGKPKRNWGLGSSLFARRYWGNQGLCPKIRAKGEEFLVTEP